MQSVEIPCRKGQRSFLALCLLQPDLLIITDCPGIFRLVDALADEVSPLTAWPADGFLAVAARLALATRVASKGDLAAPAANFANVRYSP